MAKQENSNMVSRVMLALVDVLCDVHLTNLAADVQAVERTLESRLTT